MASRYDKDFNSGPDSDGDGLTDDFERVTLGTNPNKRDSDGDGLSDLREKDFGSNPNLYDTDGDGMNDGREVTVGTAPFMADTDGDGTDDRAEVIGGTAHAPDADGDGKADWVQSVRDADMDGDGLNDGEEQWLRTNILSDNSDGDNLDDFTETVMGGDMNRDVRSFDGPPAPPTIQVPTTPENPDIVPNLDGSDPGSVLEASLDAQVDDLSFATAAPEPMPEPSFEPIESFAGDTGASVEDTGFDAAAEPDSSVDFLA